MARSTRLDLITAFGQDPEDPEDEQEEDFTERGLRLVDNLKREIAAGTDPDQQEVPFTLQRKLERAQRGAEGARPAGGTLGGEILGAVDEATSAVGEALGFDGRALSQEFVQGEEAAGRIDRPAGVEGPGGMARETTRVQPEVTPTPEEELPELAPSTAPQIPLPPELARERRMAGMVDENGEPMFPNARTKWFSRDQQEIARIAAGESDARARRFGLNTPNDNINPVNAGHMMLDEMWNSFRYMTSSEQAAQGAEVLEFLYGLTGEEGFRQRAQELEAASQTEARAIGAPFAGVKNASNPVELVNGLLRDTSNILGSAMGLMFAAKEEAAAGALAGSAIPGIGTGLGALGGLATGISLAHKNRMDRDLQALAQREDAPWWIEDPTMRDMVSGVTAAGIGAIEVVTEGRISREAVEALTNSVRRQATRNLFFSRSLRAARQEAGEELGQLGMEEGVKALAGADINPRHLGQKAVESMAAGAIGGFGMGASTVLPQKGLESIVDVANEITVDDFTPSDQPGGMIDIVGRQRVIENASNLSDSQLATMWAEASSRGDNEVANAVQGEFQRRVEAAREASGPSAGEPATMASEALSEGQTDAVRDVPQGAEARAELQVGDVVGKRRVVDITDSGSIRWKAVDDIRAEEGPTDNEYSSNDFVPAPEDTEIEEFIQRRRAEPPTPDLPEARMEAVEMAAAESGIQMDSDDFNRFVMDTRKIRVDYQREAWNQWDQARNEANPLGEQAYQRKQNQLVSIGTSSQLDLDATARATALAQAMAMEDVRQRSSTRTPSAIGIDEAALQIARLDEQSYQQIQTWLSVRQAQDPVNDRLRVRAEQFRQEPQIQERAERDHQRVNDLVAQGNVRSSRGASQGTRIRTPEGEVGEIQNRPNFGVARVNFADRNEQLDLREVDIIPRAGELFVGTAGNVYEAENLMDSSNLFTSPETAQRVQARAADGSSVQVDLSDVERVSNDPDSRAQLQDAFEEQQRRARERGLIDLRRQQMGVLKQTGQEVTVDAISDTHLRITDPQSGSNSIIEREAVGTPASAVTDPDMEAEPITTFEPGTTPSREGYHINFLRLSNIDATTLKENFRAAAQGEEAAAEAVVRALDTFSSDGKLFLAPQPTSGDQQLVGIELPAESRSLTDAAKRLLGVFSGNESLDAISPQTMAARVRVDPENLQDITLYDVPPGLQQAIKSPFALRDPNAEGSVMQDNDQVRDYLGRLPDLNFEMIPEASEAISEASALADQHQREMEAGDFGKAEQTALEVQHQLSKARQKEFEAARDALNEAWDAATQEIREQEMSLEDVNLVEQMNEGNLDAVREALQQMPGARGKETGIPAVFNHPTVPGFRMVVRKETVLTRVGGQHMTRAEAEGRLRRDPGLRETLGVGDPEVELPNGTTVERSLVDQLSTDQYLSMVRGSEIEGSRDIDNVSFVSPDGRQILHRRIGADAQFEVPRSQENQALNIIEEEVNEGNDPLPRLREEIGGRSDVEVVELPGLEGLYRFLEEDPATETVLLRSLRTGEEITINSDQMATAQFETVEEPMTTVNLPRRLSPEETLDEVIKKIDQMDSRAHWYSTGEFRHNSIAGKYGEVRQREDGEWMAMVYEEPQDSNKIADKRSTLTRKLQFQTQEEAQQWLENNGMSRGAEATQFAEKFRNLPEVESISVANMAKVEKSLRQILRGYIDGWEGFIPQPVRNYASEFAIRWYQMGMPETMMDGEKGIYGDWRIRRALNLFTTKDMQHAAENVDSEVIPNDYRLTEGILLDGPNSNFDPQVLQEAREVYKDWQERTRLIEHSVPASQLPVDESVAPDPHGSLTQRHKLVRFGDEERLGAAITGTGLAQNQPVTVQYFDGGQAKTTEVRPSDVYPVYSQDMRDQYIRSAKEAKGELLEVVQTPDMGQASLDRRFGLDGVTNEEVFEEKFIENASRMLGDLNRFDEGDDIQYTNETIENATEVFTRIKELGLRRAEQVLFPEDSPVRLIVQREALADLKARYSMSSPLGDVVARAKLDLLTEDQRTAIEDQRRWLGLPPNTPDHKVVEYLAENAWEPQFANVLWNLRNDLGFLNMTEQMDDVIAELAEKGVSVEMRAPTSGAPDPNSIFSGNMFQFPRTVGEKHPTADFFRKQAERSRHVHGKRINEMRARIGALAAGAFDEDFRTPGGEDFDLAKKDFIIDLIQHPKLGEAMNDPLHNAQATADLVVEEIFEAEEDFYEFDEGSLPENVTEVKSSTFREEQGRYRLPDEPDWNWRDAFEHTREIMRWANQMEVMSMLLQGQKVESVNPEAENWEQHWQDFTTRANIDGEEAELMLERLNRGEPVMAVTPFTDLSNGKNETEVLKFMDLRDQYASLDQIPETVRENMAPWMIEEFDFWKQWGINNYAPRVVMGQFVIKDANTGEPVARAPSSADAQVLIKREQERGRLDPGGDYTIEVKNIRTSDVEHQVLPPDKMRKFYARAVSMFEQGMDAGSAEWVNALTEALHMSEIRAPQNPHTRARIADLTDTLEDPYQSLMVYTGRVSRQRHLVDIVRAYSQAESLDPALSRAYGTSQVFDNTRIESYLEDLRDSYLGRESKWEERWNNVMRFMRAIPANKEKFLRKMREGADYQLRKDPEFLMNLAEHNYAGREFTELAIGSQSLIRLGGNLGGSVANLTQTPLFVPPELMNRGATATESLKYLGQAVADQRKYHREVADAETEGMPEDIEIEPSHLGLNEEAQTLARFIHDLGIELMPAKGTQGTGLGILDNQATAIEFSDTTPTDQIKSLSHYALMRPFTGAEQLNRELSAFAAKRMAEERGMSYDQQVEFAQEVIDNTQFQYYDQALPKLMRGPLARIIFQFKPFVANALKFQVDLLKGAFTGEFRGSNTIRTADGKRINAREQAIKSMALHSVIGGLLGGTSYLGGTLLGSAAGSALSKLWRWFGNDAGPRGNIGAAAGYHSVQQLPGPEMPHSDIFRAWDFVTGGLPAYLTGLSAGQRIAVGGQDLNPFGANMGIGDYLGPTAGWVANYLGAVDSYVGELESPTGRALLGLGGGAATAYLSGLGLPSALGLSAVGMGLSTAGTTNPYRSWLTETRGGVGFFEEILPPWMQAMRFHFDMLDGRAVDASGELRHYPPGPNTWWELSASYANLQPIKSVQERAYTNWLYNYYDRLRNARNNARDRIVQAISDGRQELADKRRMDAILRGLDISEESIDRALRRSELGPAQKLMRRIPSLHQVEIEEEAEQRFGGGGPADVMFGGGGG